LKTNSTGISNTAFGFQSLTRIQPAATIPRRVQSHASNTTGHDDAAFDYQALQSNTTGYNNAALEMTRWPPTRPASIIQHSQLALNSNTLGNNNTALDMKLSEHLLQAQTIPPLETGGRQKSDRSNNIAHRKHHNCGRR